MRKGLISLCGVLLVGSLIFTYSNIEATQQTHAEKLLTRNIFSLNIIFLIGFLVNILSFIKKEHQNEKGNHTVL